MRNDNSSTADLNNGQFEISSNYNYERSVTSLLFLTAALTFKI